MTEYEQIYNIIDGQAKGLVGVLLKRIEVLQKEGVLTPELYKAIVKELVYENSRQTKGLVKVLQIGKVIFRTRPKS